MRVTLNIGLMYGRSGILLDTQNAARYALDVLHLAGVSWRVEQSQTEPTMVITGETYLRMSDFAAIAYALSRDLKQEAIAVKYNGYGFLVGDSAEDWGEFNPEYFIE